MMMERGGKDGKGEEEEEETTTPVGVNYDE